MSNSVVVTTEEELRVACEKKVEHILIKGDLAKTVEKNMKQRKTRKKFMIGSVAIAGLGFIAAPFTGGAVYLLQDYWLQQKKEVQLEVQQFLQSQYC